jgi:di/tricarboxylate transporter
MLSQDQAFVFLVLAAALGLFVWGRWRYDLVALAALLAVAFGGLVTTEDVFAGFAHPAVITVAAVLVLSKGLLNAGVVDTIARGLTRVGGGPGRQLAALTLLTAVCSGFMNNVGALALLMPVAVWMARRGGYSPSQSLMPLAFGSLLGGMTTLIGTPPNIIVASFRPEAVGAPFGMFDFLPVGAVVTLSGVIVISLASRFLVPVRRDAESQDGLFAIDEYVTELRLAEDNNMVGQTLHDLEASLGDEAEAKVIALIRGGRKTFAPSAYKVLKADDLLLVEARPDDIKTLIDVTGLEFAESKDEGEGSLESDDVSIVEAVVGQNSPLLGTSAGAIDLRQRYRVNLLAVARHGQQLRHQLSRIRFLIGDILLLQGSAEALSKVISELRCLPLESREIPLGKRRRVLVASGIFAAGLAATTAGLAPVQLALVAASLVMILAGIVSLRDAYDAIDWPILVLLASMMPVGEAFETTGAAERLAEQVATLTLGGGMWLLLPVVMVATMLLSNVVNNAAAAVLMAPVAVRVATTLDVSADALLMGVAVGASAAFLTPIGHQSNTLVMEPGGYRFGDYWRLGLVVSATVVLVATPMILWVWTN